jgi:hypothetical protein
LEALAVPDPYSDPVPPVKPEVYPHKKMNNTFLRLTIVYARCDTTQCRQSTCYRLPVTLGRVPDPYMACGPPGSKLLETKDSTLSKTFTYQPIKETLAPAFRMTAASWNVCRVNTGTHSTVRIRYASSYLIKTFRQHYQLWRGSVASLSGSRMLCSVRCPDS